MKIRKDSLQLGEIVPKQYYLNKKSIKFNKCTSNIISTVWDQKYKEWEFSSGSAV